MAAKPKYASPFIAFCANIFGQDEDAGPLLSQLQTLTSADVDEDGFSLKAIKIVSDHQAARAPAREAARAAAEREGVRAFFAATWGTSGRDLDREIAAAHRTAQAMLNATRIAMGQHGVECDPPVAPKSTTPETEQQASRNNLAAQILAADLKARGMQR